MTHIKKFIVFSLLTFFLAGSITYLQETRAEAKVTSSLKNGTLTIKGRGKMPASLKIEKVKQAKKVKKVVVQSGVTSIPKEAFSNCSNIKEVNIANTVKEIGHNAFKYCYSIKKLTIPGNFKRTGTKKNWMLINEYAEQIIFNSHVDLQTITCLPAKAFVVPNDDPNFKSYQGCIYTKDGKSLVRVPSDWDTVTTAPGCTEFCTQAFLYNYANNISPTYSLGTRKIVLSKDIQTINTSKFFTFGSKNYYDYCDLKIETEQLNANDLFHLLECFPQITKKQNKTTGNYFYDLSVLPSAVKLVDDCYIYGDVLFYYTGKDKSFTIPNGISKIAPQAFIWNDTLTQVIVPEGVTQIGNQAFQHCNKLKEVKLPESLTHLSERAFYESSLQKINFPTKLREIPAEAFYSCTITSIIIPDSIETIGYEAFGSNGTSSISLGKNVKRIEDRAFQFCGLKSLTLPHKLTYIGKYAFSLSNLTKLTIPANVKTIKSGAFYSTKDMSVTIQGNPKHYAGDAFSAKKYTYKKGVKNAITNMLSWDFGKTRDKNKVDVSVKWGKISNISGYEVKVSTDSKMKKKVSKKTVTGNKTKATLTVYNKKYDEDMYCMVRPFKKKKGKKIYGRWTKEVMEIGRC